MKANISALILAFFLSVPTLAIAEMHDEQGEAKHEHHHDDKVMQENAESADHHADEEQGGSEDAQTFLVGPDDIEKKPRP